MEPVSGVLSAMLPFANCLALFRCSKSAQDEELIALPVVNIKQGVLNVNSFQQNQISI